MSVRLPTRTGKVTPSRSGRPWQQVQDGKEGINACRVLVAPRRPEDRPGSATRPARGPARVGSLTRGLVQQQLLHAREPQGVADEPGGPHADELTSLGA